MTKCVIDTQSVNPAHFTIGIDPDSGKHGVALYENETLVSLNSFTLLQLRDFLLAFFGDDFSSLQIHIEDNASINAAYTAEKAKLSPTLNAKKQLKARLKMAKEIGMCIQSQTELERMFEELKIDVVKRQQSKRWKSTGIETEQFKRATGWTKRSNEDTRSAAWFGFTGARERKFLKRSIG